jgi:hypothetical protein
MIIVHHLDDWRSQRILWLLEELRELYEIEQHRRDPVTRSAPVVLKQIHPLGKSPVIVDNGRVVAESGAIIEHILRRYGKGRLQPRVEADTGSRPSNVTSVSSHTVSPRRRPRTRRSMLASRRGQVISVIEKTTFQSQGDRVGAIVGVEFGEDVLDTTFDRIFRNIQLFTDPTVVLAACDQS